MKSLVEHLKVAQSALLSRVCLKPLDALGNPVPQCQAPVEPKGAVDGKASGSPCLAHCCSCCDTKFVKHYWYRYDARKKCKLHIYNWINANTNETMVNKQTSAFCSTNRKWIFEWKLVVHFILHTHFWSSIISFLKHKTLPLQLCRFFTKNHVQRWIWRFQIIATKPCSVRRKMFCF